MRILIDARFYGEENTGIGRYTVGLVQGLVKRDTKNEYTILLRKNYFNRLNLPKNWKKVLADIPHYSILEQIKLPPLIYREDPDIVHFLHFNVPIFFKRDYVVTIHDLLMHKQKGKEASTLPLFVYFFKRIAYKLVFWMAVHRSKKVIVPTNVVKNDILETYKIKKDKVEVVYEGVSKLISKKDIDEDLILKKYSLEEKKYVIYTGNAYPHKNLKRAVEAIRILKDRGENVTLAIVSPRSVFTKRLEKLVQESGCKDLVSILGFVPDLDLGVLYKKSIAFLYPSLSEGFGLPALEAMLAGTISIVSDILVFHEVYKDNAMYFDPKSADEIADSIHNVSVMEKSKRRKMILKSQKFVKTYSWNKMAQNTLAIYESSAGLR